jgi:hypothetical protein
LPSTRMKNVRCISMTRPNCSPDKDERNSIPLGIPIYYQEGRYKHVQPGMRAGNCQRKRATCKFRGACFSTMPPNKAAV